VTVTFLHITRKPHHRPRTWLDLQKANETPIPTLYSSYGNIINFSHTSLSYRQDTRATRCVTPTVLYTKADAKCDELATVLRQSTCRGAIFLLQVQNIYDKVVEKVCPYFWRHPRLFPSPRRLYCSDICSSFPECLPRVRFDVAVASFVAWTKLLSVECWARLVGWLTVFRRVYRLGPSPIQGHDYRLCRPCNAGRGQNVRGPNELP